MRVFNSGLQNRISGFSSIGLGLLQPVLNRSFSSRIIYPSVARRMKSTLAEGSRVSEITDMQKDLINWKSNLKELNDARINAIKETYDARINAIKETSEARFKSFEEGSKIQRWMIGVVFTSISLGFGFTARAIAGVETRVNKLEEETENLKKQIGSVEGKVDSLTEQVNKIFIHLKTNN